MLDNCLDELISIEQARDVYGVVIDGRAVDAPATDALRAELRARSPQAKEKA